MDPIKKKVILKLTDSAMQSLAQPSTQTGIVAVLSAMTFFTVHNIYVQVGTVVVNLITGIYNWFRKELMQADIEAHKIVENNDANTTPTN